LNSYDSAFDIGPTILAGRAVPTRPGKYRISYQYGNSTGTAAEYTVAAAKLEADAVARVHDILYSDHPKVSPPEPLPTYVHVLALRSEGLTYICVQQAAVARTGLVVRQADIGSNLDFDEDHAQVALAMPFKRVATSNASVVRLLATADAQENLTIEWTDSTGRQERLYYPASYPARRPKQNQ
jgi:hypothetical protein